MTNPFTKDAPFLPAQVAGPGVQPIAVPSSWDQTADVVVVGSGAAAHAAAIEAYDNGASVIMIEKLPYLGGNSVMAGGNCQMPCNAQQVAEGIVDHVETAYHDYWTLGKYRNVPELLNLFCTHAADTAVWLQNLGVVWGKVTQQAECSVPRTITPTSASAPNTNITWGGTLLMYVLNQALVKRNIPLQLNTKMTGIIRASSTDPVLGIQAVNTVNGSILYYKANKAVVLGTGDFKANYQFARAFMPELDEEWSWSGGPYSQCTGDGHLAAMAIGAAIVDSAWPVSFLPAWGVSQDVVWTPNSDMLGPTTVNPAMISAAMPVANPWAIFVDASGNRFVNEAIWNASPTAEVDSPWISAYLNIPYRPRNVWAVVDSNGAKAIGWNPAEFQAATEVTSSPYLDPAYIAWSNTTDGLASLMGISATQFDAAVTRYNGFAAAGNDTDFGRPAPMNPLNTPPYLAAKLLLNGHDQCNGLRVNTKMQVIDCVQELKRPPAMATESIDNEIVIPHLYAVGELAGGFFGAARGHGKIGSYVVNGRVGGMNAAAETPISSTSTTTTTTSTTTTT